MEPRSGIISYKKPTHPSIHPPTRHLSLECFDLSIYWPDLDQTLNKGSWQYILQITTVTTTFVLGTFVHISNISSVTSTYILECGTPSSACFHFFSKLKVFLLAGPLRHTGNERQLEQISECGFSCGPVQECSIVAVL